MVSGALERKAVWKAEMVSYPDMDWRCIGTFFAGLALSGGLMALPVSAQDMSLSAPSVVRAKAKAKFSSSLTGTIKLLPFKEGDEFAQGAILTRLDCATQIAQLQAATADHQAAQADLTARKALHGRGGLGKVQVDVAEAQTVAARARQTLAEAVVDGCEIKAPFDGRIVEILVNEFEYVDPSQSLLSIVSTERPEVEISAPSVWLRKIDVGSVGEVRFEEVETSFAIRIVTIGATVDPVSATIKLTAAFQGDVQGILPGMSGRARFE